MMYHPGTKTQTSTRSLLVDRLDFPFFLRLAAHAQHAILKFSRLNNGMRTIAALRLCERGDLTNETVWNFVLAKVPEESKR